jgi:hypothetical protein
MQYSYVYLCQSLFCDWHYIAAAAYVHVVFWPAPTSVLTGRTWHPFPTCAAHVGLFATLAALGVQWPERMMVQTSVIFVHACTESAFRACWKRCHGFTPFSFRIVRVRLRVRWIGCARFFRMWIWPFDFAWLLLSVLSTGYFVLSAKMINPVCEAWQVSLPLS